MGTGTSSSMTASTFQVIAIIKEHFRGSSRLHNAHVFVLSSLSPTQCRFRPQPSHQSVLCMLSPGVFATLILDGPCCFDVAKSAA